MAQDNLIRFSQVILTEAEEKRKKYIKDLDTQREEVMSKSKKELKNKAQRRVRQQCTALTNQLEGSLARMRNEIRVDLISARTHMVEYIFAQVLENVKNYTETQAYKENIAADFVKAAAELSAADTVCTARAQDIPILKKTNTEATFKVADEEFLGGFILESDEKKVLYDMSLAERLEEAKLKFARSGNLMID